MDLIKFIRDAMLVLMVAAFAAGFIWFVATATYVIVQGISLLIFGVTVLPAAGGG